MTTHLCEALPQSNNHAKQNGGLFSVGENFEYITFLLTTLIMWK